MAVRGKLNRDRVVGAAAKVADRGGISAVSMRQVATELGVEAMSLYNHVPNKEALLDALSEWVFTQIQLPQLGEPWRAAMVSRAESARLVLGQHPWALGMLESRPTPGPSLLRHHDRVLGCLFSAGFSAELATHAFSTLDAFVYGFVLTESGMPFAPGEGAEAQFAAKVAPSLQDYPFLVRSLSELLQEGTYSFAGEFAKGLELILDGLEKQLAGNHE